MTTIACLGATPFTMITNLQRIRYAWDSAIVAHDVVGAPPVYEDVGDGEATIDIEGVIFPHAFGVDGGFTRLSAVRAARVPVPFILGTWLPLGWVIIDSLKRSDESLGPTGVGNKIDFSASLLRVGVPGLGMVSQIMRFL